VPIEEYMNLGYRRKAKRNKHHIGSQRVIVEHVIREMKMCKIIATKYRNKRKRFCKD
jgi:hypothetical protein